MQTVLSSPVSFRSPVFLIWSLLALGLTAALFYEAFLWMAEQWLNTEEYSHGMMIPFVSAWLAWQRRFRLTHDTHSGNGFGVLLMAAALALFLVSDLATVYFGVLLALVLCLYGLVLLTLGWRNTREMAAPLLMLLFMIPLPSFINNNLSSELQLISSSIGVAFMRLFDITVFLEGNVIDLGSYKLQVVDACSGLRYLYPLVALGFILAYLCDIRMWQRVLLFVSTIPITVIMNSIRIGGIGVTVEYWGPQMAEGLLHDVEGWFMFMASLAVLLLELVLMLRLSGDRRALTQVFVIEDNGANAAWQPVRHGPSLRLLSAALLTVLAVAIYAFGHSRSSEMVPERMALNHFPLLMGEWHGTPDTLESIYIDALKFDDYMIADYRRGAEHDAQHLNFYIAWYGSQRSGQSAHSPRSCIPGGGWRIESIEQVHLDDLYLNTEPLLANRTVIRKGEARQIVYYWFQQRGRIITNEYLVKWYIFWDALTHNRSDGALVRLTTILKNTGLERDQALAVADAQAADFMREALPRMNDFIPGQVQ